MPPAKQRAERGPAKMTDRTSRRWPKGARRRGTCARTLEALAANKPKRGRKRTKETVQRQLDEVSAQIGPAAGLSKLELAQRRIDLAAELEAFDVTVDLSDLRRNFLKPARPYAESKGISYSRGGRPGSQAEDLKAAGITRGSS